MTSSENGVVRRFLGEIPRTKDMVVHVSRAEKDGVVWLDIRDFSLPNKTYHRGVMLPWSKDAVQGVIAALGRATF